MLRKVVCIHLLRAVISKNKFLQSDIFDRALLQSRIK